MPAMILAQAAETANATDALDQINIWWAAVGGIVPFITARIVNPKARSLVKFLIAMGLSVAAALVVMVPQVDWSAVTPESLFLWLAAFVGVVQTVYSSVKVSNRFFTDEQDGMNDMAFAGRSGIGGVHYADSDRR